MSASSRCGPVAALILIALYTSSARGDDMARYLFDEQQGYYASLLASPIPASQVGWLTEPELRITPEQDVRGLNTETYSLRFRPTSSRERRAEHKLFNYEAELATLELEDLLGTVLRERYLQVIELAEQEGLLSIARQALALDEAEAAAEESRSAESNYDLTDWQKALLTAELRQQEVTRREAQIDRYRQATQIKQPALSATEAADGQLHLSRTLRSPEEIEALLAGEQLHSHWQAVAHRKAQAELKAVQQKDELEKNKRRFGLDLVELSYENKGIDSYNMTFGFRLPSRSYSGHRSARECVAAQRRADLVSSMVVEHTTRAVQNVYLELEGLHATRHSMRNFSRRNPPQDMATNFVYQRHRLRLMAQALSQHADALRALVDALATAGLVYQRPLHNWLASP